MKEEAIRLIGTPFTLQVPYPVNSKGKKMTKTNYFHSFSYYSTNKIFYEKEYSGFLFGDKIYIEFEDQWQGKFLQEFRDYEKKFEKYFKFSNYEEPDLDITNKKDSIKNCLILLTNEINKLKERLDNI